MIDPNGFMQRPGPEVTPHDRVVVRGLVARWAASQDDPADAERIVLAAIGDVLQG